MATIRIVAYDPLWPRIFGYLQARIWHQVAPHITAIVHVGSTAVPGMTAKPTIDMDIVVADQSHLAPVIALLAPLGYHHLGDLGITGRRPFADQWAFLTTICTSARRGVSGCAITSPCAIICGRHQLR